MPSLCLAEVANAISSLRWRPGVLWPWLHHSLQLGPKNKGGRGRAPGLWRGRCPSSYQAAVTSTWWQVISQLPPSPGLWLKPRDLDSLPCLTCLHSASHPSDLIQARLWVPAEQRHLCDDSTQEDQEQIEPQLATHRWRPRGSLVAVTRGVDEERVWLSWKLNSCTVPCFSPLRFPQILGDCKTTGTQVAAEAEVAAEAGRGCRGWWEDQGTDWLLAAVSVNRAGPGP